MKTKLLAGLLFAGSMAFGAHFSIGVNIGVPYAYYPPPPQRVAYVAAPGPGYAWVNGYYYPVGGGWRWRAGYWAARPYAGSYGAQPRYEGGRYFEGRWERRERWDRDDRYRYGYRR